MTDFKAKMYQIRFRLGLRPRPRWGSLQCSPDPLSGFGARFAAGGGAGLGRRGRGEGREAPKLLLNQGPPEPCYATVYLPILWSLYINVDSTGLLCGTFQLSTRAPLTTVVVIKRVRIRPACFRANAPLATFSATTGNRASLCVSIIITVPRPRRVGN